ncbi:MAG: RodZ domain-containing protein [Acidimicrobiales bacterium]
MPDQGPPNEGRSASWVSSGGVRPRHADLEPPTEVVSEDELRRQATVRRVTVAAVAAVALTFIIVASILLAGGPSPKTTSPTTTTKPPGTHATTTSTSLATTTTRPAVLSPLTNTDGVVSYLVPKGSYTVVFADTGTLPSWLGVEPSYGSGTLLWQNEVQPQQALTYQAKGPVAVDIGAPVELKITVNGVPCTLPADIPGSTIAFVTSAG